jgi:hypothetical protein
MKGSFACYSKVPLLIIYKLILLLYKSPLLVIYNEVSLLVVYMYNVSLLVITVQGSLTDL